MRLGTNARSLVPGKSVAVWIEDGSPRATAVVELEDFGRAQQQRERLEIPLNEKGAGWRSWTVPSWSWVKMTCEGCAPWQQQVKTPPSLARKMVASLERATRALDFVTGHAGKPYGIGVSARAKLLRKVLAGTRGDLAFSRRRQHLLLVEEILRVPPGVRGDVVECGCAHGAATVALSLACAVTNRRLLVCDSFEGLPAPKPGEEVDRRFDGQTCQWSRGDYASSGGIEGVKSRVRARGNVDVCRFVKGYFEDTLAHLETDAIVLVFEDADLLSSVQDCLRHLWPKLQPWCKFFCHEPWSYDIVSLFYDEDWWRDQLGLVPPGFFGSGGGDLRAPDLGYALKLDPAHDERLAVLRADPGVTAARRGRAAGA